MSKVIWQQATSLLYNRWQHSSQTYAGVVHSQPKFWGREVLGVSDGTFESAIVVFYTLFIVTKVLSLTIPPQFAIKYLNYSNQQGVGQFGEKFGARGRLI